MGLIHWEIKRFINPPPRKSVEINFIKYSKKLIDQDLERFNNITDELINKLRSKIKLMFTTAAIALITAILGLFSLPSPRYQLLLINVSAISLLALAYAYLVSSISHDWIGIYERSWIKFLQQKRMLAKITLLQNITFKTTSIVLPSVKSYLEQNNIPLTLNETN